MTSQDTPGRLRYSVIMPAYNEARHLAANVGITLAEMEGLGGTFEIIVVDDCSTDASSRILRELAASRPEVRPVLLSRNQGKGHALRAGFDHARGDLILFLDADLELHPRQFRRFVDILERERVDVVIGSKSHPESRLNYPWRRRLMSRVYFFLVKLLFGLPVKDTQTGMKLFKREVLALAFPRMLVKQYAYDLELLILAHRQGCRIAEAPVELDYKASFGHIRPRDVFNIWWDTMAIYYRLNWLRYYDRRTS